MCCLAAVMSVPMLFAAEPTISITATPRYPWNGLVDLAFTIEGDEGAKYDTSFSAQDVIGGTNLAMKTIYKPSGGKANVGLEKLAPGTYSWLWDAPTDVGKDFVGENVVIDAKVGDAITYTVKFNANGGSGSMAVETFESGVAKPLTANKFARAGYIFQGWATSASGAVLYSDKQSVKDLTATAGGTVNLYAVWKLGGIYMVIDLSGGPNAASYPISYLDSVPSGGWSDTYKTTKMVLRKVSPGTFTMGDQVHGGSKYTNIKLTKPYYIGVFECTQKQWELVRSFARATFSVNGSYRPADRVSYNAIRGSSAGAKWPASSDVDSASYMGVLRKCTGMKFDLPTEAQWEYACRAGKTTDFNNGSNYKNVTGADANMAKVGRYWHNGGSTYTNYSPYQKAPLTSATAKVGSYAANAWGIYDMHGNMSEWCLDWYGSLASSRTDPKGPTSGTKRVLRGDSWYCRNAADCSSWKRGSCPPGGDVNGNGAIDFNLGFRVAVTVE